MLNDSCLLNVYRLGPASLQSSHSETSNVPPTRDPADMVETKSVHGAVRPALSGTGSGRVT